jgi:hypothetical protein
VSQCGLCNWVIKLRNFPGETLTFHVVNHLGRTIFLYTPLLFSIFLCTPSSFKICFAKTLWTRVQLVEIRGFFFLVVSKLLLKIFQNFSLICQTLHKKHTQLKNPKKWQNFVTRWQKFAPQKKHCYRSKVEADS